MINTHKNSILFILIFLIYLQSALNNPAYAQSKTPFKMHYGIFLKKIVPNFKDASFYAEFYWWTRFTNDSTKTGISNDEIMALQYVNGNEAEIDAFANEVQEIKHLGNNEFYYTGYHQGDFYFHTNFEEYPFDKQKLNIEIEHSILPDDKLIIEPDISSYTYSKMDTNFFGISNDLLINSMISLKIYKSSIAPGSCVYNSNFGDPDFSPASNYSRLTFSVYLERIVIPYITKFFIPLGIILLLVYFVFFIPPDKLDMAAGLTVTSLLSAIAFQFTINGDLPEIGYLIYVDKVFYLTYILIVLAMGESLYTFYLDLSGDEKKKKLAQQIDLAFRFLFPLIFILSSYLFTL